MLRCYHTIVLQTKTFPYDVADTYITYECESRTTYELRSKFLHQGNVWLINTGMGQRETRQNDTSHVR